MSNLHDILDRIIPSGSTATWYALRSLANGKFVQVRSDGRLVATADKIDASAMFKIVRGQNALDGKFGLVSRTVDKFASAVGTGTSPILTAARPSGWGMDLWEAFEAREGNWPAGRYDIAIASMRNGKLVCAENAGAEFLRARSVGAYDWEHFRLMPVLDMSQVLTAFSDRHPGMCKERSSHFDDSGLGWMNGGKVFESRVKGAPGNQIAITFMSPNWENGGEPAFAITDWYALHTERAGLAGDYALKREKDIPPEAYTTFGNRRGVLDGSMLALFDRYMTPDMVRLPIVSEWREFTGPTADQDQGLRKCFNVVDFIGERETGNGKRWIISVSSDTNYPHESGHDSGWPYEYTYFDLGPADGIYDPALGYVGYKQAYAANGGALTGQMAEEFYARIVPGSYHRKIGTLFEI